MREQIRSPFPMTVHMLLTGGQPAIPPEAIRVHRIATDDELREDEGEVRECTTCHEEKPATEFYVKTNGTRYSQCKACCRKRQKKTRARGARP